MKASDTVFAALSSHDGSCFEELGAVLLPLATKYQGPNVLALPGAGAGVGAGGGGVGVGGGGRGVGCEGVGGAGPGGAGVGVPGVHSP